MTASPEPLVQIKEKITEMFLMMLSTTTAQMILLCQKELSRALGKKYLQLKSPESLVQNQNNFTEMVLMLLSTKIDHKVQLG